MLRTVAFLMGILLTISVIPIFTTSGDNSLYAQNWPTFRYDLGRTGYSPSSAPDNAILGWNKVLSGANAFWSSPSVVGNKLYVGNDDGNLYCLNVKNGDIVWKYHAGPYSVWSSPSVAYGMVFFGGPERTITALPCDDPNSDGLIDPSEIIWNYTVGPSNPGTNAVNCGSPGIKDGKVFIGAVDQYFYCFNATEPGPKTYIWRTYTPFRGQHAFSSSPAFGRCMIFAGTGNQGGPSCGRLYAFNETTGDRVWEFELGDITYSSPTVYDDKVYIANSGDWVISAGNKTFRLFCLDIDGFLDGIDDGVPDTHYGNSDLLWSYDTGKYVYSSPAVHDGRLYFGCDNGNLTCIDSTTGTKLWVCNTLSGNGGEPGGIMGSPAVADGKVFVGTQDGMLLALPETDPNSDGIVESSEIIWSYNIGGKVVCSPTVAHGAVFIGNQMGGMFCFGTPAVSENRTQILMVAGFVMVACIWQLIKIKDESG